jgi:hypothetical protein
MKKRNMVIFVIAAITLAAVFPKNYLAADTELPDIRGHWAETYISALVEKGGISGMPDGKFHPNDAVTLKQFVKIIIGCEYGEIAPVDGGDWASGFLQKALDIEIIDTVDMENTDPIKRFDAARIIANSLIFIYGEQEEADTSIVQEFEDYPACKSCRGGFESTVGQCYVKGIISGRPGPVFDGDDILTRAEACILIMKMIKPELRNPINQKV